MVRSVSRDDIGNLSSEQKRRQKPSDKPIAYSDDMVVGQLKLPVSAGRN
jgi:hypothetical protein